MKFPETYSDLVDLIYEQAARGPKLRPGYYLCCRCPTPHDDEVYEEWCLECVQEECLRRGMDPNDYSLVQGEYTHRLYCSTCGAALETDSIDVVGIDTLLDLFERRGLKDSPDDWLSMLFVIDNVGFVSALDGGPVPGWMSTYDWEESLRRWRRVRAIVAGSLLGTTADVAISLGLADNPNP